MRKCRRPEEVEWERGTGGPGGALGLEKLQRDFDQSFWTTALNLFLLWYLYAFICTFYYCNTDEMEDQYWTAVNKAMSYHLRPIWSLVKIILNVTLYEAIASIIVKPVLGMHESTVSWI